MIAPAGGRQIDDALPNTYTRHCLRHATATLMLAAGVSAKTAADRPGHHSAVFTPDRYAHAIQKLDDGAAAKL